MEKKKCLCCYSPYLSNDLGNTTLQYKARANCVVCRMKVSLKLHLYFWNLSYCCGASKGIHLWHHPPVLPTVQSSTKQLPFYHSKIEKKKMRAKLPKSNVKRWVYEIHCVHIFFRRASSEAFSFYPESMDPPILNCWILCRVNFDRMYRLTISGRCAKVIASATVTQFILLK